MKVSRRSIPCGWVCEANQGQETMMATGKTPAYPKAPIHRVLSMPVVAQIAVGSTGSARSSISRKLLDVVADTHVHQIANDERPAFFRCTSFFLLEQVEFASEREKMSKQ